MQEFCLITVLISLLRIAQSANDGQCYLEGVTDDDWAFFYTNTAVDDTERTVFRYFNASGITAVTSVTGDAANYVSVTFGSDFLLIAPSSNFENYEQNEPSTSATPTLIVIITLTCTAGSSSLYFHQPINDINNHDPEFGSSTYSYTLPMPFPSGIQISGVFGDEITATDIDITNVAIDFSIEPEGDFTISYGAALDSSNKRHSAILYAATTLRLTSTTTYTLTATDQGTNPGPRSTTATLVIHVDEENSVISSPSFSSAYYEASYIVGESGTDSISLEGTITLEDTDYENTTFTVGGDYASYFDLEVGSNQVDLSLSQNLPNEVLDSNSFVLVTITASRDGAETKGSTVVLVNLPEKVTAASPTFTSALYTATYEVGESGTDSISLESTIALEDTDYENTTFAVGGDYASYFTVGKGSNQVELSLFQNLPEEVLESNSFVAVTITATRETAETKGSTVVLVNLPEKAASPVFTSTLYTASYTVGESGVDSIGLENTIALDDSDYENTNFSLTGDYASYFTIEVANNQVELSLFQNLPDEVLDSSTFIALVITAARQNAVTEGSAVVLINLPVKATAASPTFGSPYYSATYIVNENEIDTISLEASITLNDADYENTTFTLEGDYSSYFSLDTSNSEVQITLSTELSEELLYSSSFILVPIKASRENAETDIYTVLVVNLPGEQCATTPSPETTTNSPMFTTTGCPECTACPTETTTSFTCPPCESTTVPFTTNPNPDTTLSHETTTSNTGTTLLPYSTPSYTTFPPEATTSAQNYTTTTCPPCDCTTPFYTTNTGTDTTSNPDFTTKFTDYTDTTTETHITQSTGNTNAPPSPGSSAHTTYYPTAITDCPTVTTECPTIPTECPTIPTECSTTSTECPPCETQSTSTLTTNSYSTDSTNVVTTNSYTSDNTNTYSTDGTNTYTTTQSYSSSSDITFTVPSHTASTAHSPDHTDYTTICPTVATECPTVTTECPVTECDCSSKTSSVTTECDCSSTISAITTSSGINSPTTSFTEGPTTPTSATSCDCPACTDSTIVWTTIPSGTTQSPTSVVKFDQDYYAFSLEPLHAIGIIGSVSASSSQDESITYSILANSGSSLPSQLLIDSSTGELRTTDRISSGSYYLTATATGESSGSSDTALVLLYVGSVQVCNDDIRTAYSVIAKHITEEQQNYDILTFDESLNSDNYSYVIVEQYPVTNPFVFEINRTTGSLQTAEIIDREWKGISDQYVSQFTVRLKIIGAEESFEPVLGDNATSFYVYQYANYRDVYQEEGRAWINVEDKLYNVANETVVAVIVDDINDNAPVFSEGSVLVVGYPADDLVNEISPPYLTTVHATDADIGENALISYSTDSDYFLVHPSTGIVYVGTGVFSNNDITEFTITATDRNGSSDGLSTSLRVQVKKLDENKLTVLTIDEAVLEDVNDILESFKTSTGLTIKELTSSVIPSTSSPRKKRSTDDYSLRIISYALDSENELVSSEDLQRAIANTDIAQSYTVQAWSSGSNIETSGNSTTGYLAAVIVLAILLAVFLLAAIAFYFFKIRKPKNYDEMKEDPSPPAYKKNVPTLRSSTKSDISTRRPTEYPVDTPKVEENGQPDRKIHFFTRSNSALSERRPTEYAFASPPVEDDDDDLTKKVSDEQTNKTLERRKSVSFNVNVEQIEIEKDEDKDEEKEEVSEL